MERAGRQKEIGDAPQEASSKGLVRAFPRVHARWNRGEHFLGTVDSLSGLSPFFRLSTAIQLLKVGHDVFCKSPSDDSSTAVCVCALTALRLLLLRQLRRAWKVRLQRDP